MPARMPEQSARMPQRGDVRVLGETDGSAEEEAGGKVGGIRAAADVLGSDGREESEDEEMAWKWIALTMLAICAGSWIGFLTVKALNGLCYEIEVLKLYLTDEEG